jgi:hypothetical protein
MELEGEVEHHGCRTVRSLKLFCLGRMRKTIIILSYKDGFIMYRFSIYGSIQRIDPYPDIRFNNLLFKRPSCP